jgi:hypothetical protein
MGTGKLIIGTVGSILAVSACRYWFKYSNFYRRASLDGEQLYGIFDIQYNKHNFDMVINKISELYGVPSAKLRPSDSFSGNLRALDIWNLGSGAEELEEFVSGLISRENQKHLGSIHSLGDLAKLIDRDRPGRFEGDIPGS